MKVYAVMIHVDETSHLEKVFSSFEKAEQFIFSRDMVLPTCHSRFYQDEKYGILADIQEMKVE